MLIRFVFSGGAPASRGAPSCMAWFVNVADILLVAVLCDVSFVLGTRVPSYSHVRERQNILESLHNVEPYSMRLPDRFKYYSGFHSWWMQYQPPTLLFVPSPFLMGYHGDLVMCGSAAEETRILTLTLTECVTMAGAMSIANARNKACSTYYMGSLWFDNASEGLLFRLPSKIPDAPMYLRL